MFAIVEFKGNQYKVTEGSELKLPLFEAKPGDKIVMDKLLLLDDDKGVKLASEIKSGKVEAEVVEIGQTAKIGVLKFHSKKRYQKIGSHRQDFVKIRINKIAA